MKRLFSGLLIALLLFLYIFSPNSLVGSSASETEISTNKLYTGGDYGTKSELLAAKNVEVSSRIFELFFGKGEKAEPVMLYPGGAVFGLVIKENGVTVTSGTSTKSLMAGDRIIKINKKEVFECSDVEDAVRSSGGKKIEAEIVRGGERLTVTIMPKAIDGAYQLGAKLRSTTAGIGTVTYVEPGTLRFGGLGHGVNSADGSAVTVRNGTVNSVTLGACKKGEIGQAGELTGIMKRDAIGELYANTECGVFGTLTTLPDYCTEPMPVARKSEVRSGAAQIISTVKNGKRGIFNIEISAIDTASTGSKSFKIRVTDPTLIALTGGIVRGMSGSPIIQNGKLIGAVTHVMVANPTEGYGIFIENMLSAADQNTHQKAA